MSAEDSSRYCEAVSLGQMARALNRYRLDEIGRWLADLATRLPDHASRAVRISMARWKIAAQEGASSELLQAEELGQVHRALHRQVEIWRSLLTGEKLAKDTSPCNQHGQSPFAWLQRSPRPPAVHKHPTRHS